MNFNIDYLSLAANVQFSELALVNVDTLGVVKHKYTWVKQKIIACSSLSDFLKEEFIACKIAWAASCFEIEFWRNTH